MREFIALRREYQSLLPPWERLAEGDKICHEIHAKPPARRAIHAELIQGIPRG